MNPETLESLFYSYVNLRRRGYRSAGDVPDGCGNIAVESDDPALRPYLEEFLPQGGPPVLPTSLFDSFTGQSPSIVAAAQKLVECADNYTSTHPEKSIIQFKEFCLVKEPKEQIISIPVIRLENFTDKVTKVTWNTRDKTAFSGIHYLGCSAEMEFCEGETQKIIEIKILNPSANEIHNPIDLRFLVELTHIGGLFNPTPLTVSLKKTNVFGDNERQVLNDLPSSPPFTIDDIKYFLDGCVTNRTFHMAMTHLCSSKDDVHVQFALACELGALCLRKLSEESVLNILKDYFREDEIPIDH